MSLDSISSISDVGSTYNSTSSASANKKADNNTNSSYGTDAAAVYTRSEESKKASSNSQLIAKLKADQQMRLTQMQNLVSDMLQKQGKAFTTVDDMWKTLASGNFTVDEQTRREAEEAISEDGYWGVKQTSERIFEFAKALSGGDADKMDDMLNAFKKGYEQATKSWGKTLPDISSRTYDAVMKRFEEYKNPSSDSGSTEA